MFIAQIDRVQERAMYRNNQRPTKPDRDPLLDDVVSMLRSDNRSRHAKAQVSGLSSSTLKNWETGKVRRPQSVSLQMAYRMLGYELKPVPVSSVAPARGRV